ncbi:MAG: TRAP transporter substrate-binding protein [Desulfovibrio sp.]|nr:TRAP transporter substrate-binding protein [Desulfovibrio sp.]
MKKLVALCAALGFLCMMALGHNPAIAAEKPIVVKIAGYKPEGEPETVGMHQFGKYLAELSNGKYEVQVFPNSQLGKEDSYIDQTRRGIIQMCATGTQMSKFHPAMAMLETPMLFDDLDHAHRAMNGKTFELITDGFDKKSGIHTLNAFPLGYRHFYTKKPINTVEDMKGIKMRVPNIPLYTNFAKEAGISGQPMPYAEVAGALDQGVIDGGESPMSDIMAVKMYEIAPYITKTKHMLVMHSLFINDKFYQSLPEQDKKWFNEAAQKAAEDVWQMVKENDSKAEEAIAAGGGKLSEPGPELKKFIRDAGERTWTMFTDPKSSSYVPNAKEILDSAASYREAK